MLLPALDVPTGKIRVPTLTAVRCYAARRAYANPLTLPMRRSNAQAKFRDITTTRAGVVASITADQVARYELWRQEFCAPQ